MLVTWIPRAIEHGAEIRDLAMVGRIETRKERATGVHYHREGEWRFQKAKHVVAAGYSMETPRLLLNSANGEFPRGLANGSGRVGTHLMVHSNHAVWGTFEDGRKERRATSAPPTTADIRDAQSPRAATSSAILVKALRVPSGRTPCTEKVRAKSAPPIRLKRKVIPQRRPSRERIPCSRCSKAVAAGSKVFVEQFRATDHQEHQPDPESQRTGDLSPLTQHRLRQCMCHPERDDTENDREPCDERSRYQFQQ